MVYCGKPSKGCFTCRIRKIRCDAREGGCTQCEKQGRSCPGYRNVADLMFRDETSHVIGKARARTRNKPGDSNASTSLPDASDDRSSLTPVARSLRGRRGKSLALIPRGGGSKRHSARKLGSSFDNHGRSQPLLDSDRWLANPVTAPQRSLTPTYEERGVAFFFSRWVNIDEDATYHRFDFVYDVWKPMASGLGNEADGVLASMTAVGLMGVAHLTRSTAIIETARQAYGTALRLTNFALQSPKEAIKDTTMVSVLILGLFEVSRGNIAVAAGAFQDHVTGAEALVVLRGVEQFRTVAGVKMFMMVCFAAMVNCISRKMPMPPGLLALRRKMAKLLAANDPTWHIARPLYELFQIRHDIKTGVITDPELIIGRLTAIEAAFEELVRQIPKSWHHRLVSVTRPHPAVLGNICHMYPNIRHAILWNSLRAFRILTLETILQEIHKDTQAYRRLASDNYADLFAKSKHKLIRLCQAICASVPYHLGLLISPEGGRLDLLTPVMSLTRTVETRSVPSHAGYLGTEPTSLPSSATSLSTSALSPSSPSSGVGSGSAENANINKQSRGPPMVDPVEPDSEEEVHCFMLMASVTKSLTWPLYVVGTSPVCIEPLRAYATERLHALFTEADDPQTELVMQLVVSQDIDSQYPGLHLQSGEDNQALPGFEDEFVG